jgi:hypothetical protein
MPRTPPPQTARFTSIEPRAEEDYARFTRKLLLQAFYLKIKQALESWGISNTDKERYSRYFIVKVTPKRGRSVTFNDGEI